jgi:hypothetical protein
MSGESSQDEDRLLDALLAGWPKGRDDLALDANALWLGEQIGMTEEVVIRCVESLVKKGMMHSRDLGGILLVHPTPVALLRKAPRNSFRRIFAMLFGKS